MEITQSNHQGALLTHKLLANLGFLNAFNLFPYCNSTLQSEPHRKFSTLAT